MLRTRLVGNVRYVAIGSAAVLAVAAVVSQAAAAPGKSTGTRAARELLEAGCIGGGLIVQIGSDRDELTSALRPGDAHLLQVLDTDGAKVDAARDRIRSRGLYGRVTADTFDGRRLRYADNMVNLLVADELGTLPMPEVMRVLAPGGVALVGGRKMVKPRPEEIDQWTHFLHDASGNAVAHDRVVGPPARLQWTEGPRHMRSHEHIPGIYALVSTGGRIFYIVDEAAADAVSIRETPRWHLVARDAFNGLLLWKQPVGAWFPHIVNWGQTPPQLERKLVAVDGTVYVTLGLHAPLEALSAATGDRLRVYERTRGTEEVLWHDGVLLAVVRPVTEQREVELEKWARLVARDKSPVDKRETAEPLVKQLRQVERKGPSKLLAFDADSGRHLWTKEGPEFSAVKPLSLCADGGRVFYQKSGSVVCIDLAGGQQQWAVSAPPLRVVDGGTVYCAGKTIAALSAETGQERWSLPAELVQIRDVFVAGGSLWIGGFKPFPTKRGPSWGPYFANQRDLATGEVLSRVEPENPGHHHRCYQNKATDRYILGGRRGTEFIDLATGEVLWNSWARGVCRYGVMPCNGLLYAPPHACACYAAAKLTGFNALAPADESTDAASQSPSLEKGPAYGNTSAGSRSSTVTDWPTYRHDAQRSGGTRSPVPARLERRWMAETGPRITPPTVAGGKLVVAAVDEHRVAALDAASGKPAWQFTAGGRIDSPPTLHDGQALFGCRDGYLYCVRMSDGALAWRLRVAREQRSIAANGQIESVWPVHGSVLLHDGDLYCTAGRSSYLDGGIDLVCVDPRTGKLRSRTALYSPDPQTGRQPPQFAPAAMPGSRSDLLSCDAEHIYMQDRVVGQPGTQVSKGNPHLFALTGFLDDSWTHRSYWIFGTTASISTGCSSRDRKLVYGRLMVFRDSMVYGYGRAQVHWSNQLEDGPYRLFSLNRDGESGQWNESLPIQVRAMVLADEVLFVAGPPVRSGEQDRPGEKGPAALLIAVSAADGTELARQSLDSPPLFDGMAAAAGRLYLSLEDGNVACLASPRGGP